MYLPRYHQAKDPATLLNLIDEHPLGAWVCTGTEGLIANHIPFVLDRSRGPHGTLIGHVSRANAVWRDLHPTASSVVMFQGPQAYITPSWYPGKTAHGEVVPTWDYVVAHAHGVARAIDDRDWLLAMLERLTQTQEAARPNPWRVADAPTAYIDRLLRAIVGIEITIERLEGKHKLSQDEALADRVGTVAGLLGEQRDEAHALAGLVQTAIDAEPPERP
ncbi:MAG TPA: FMN-binding negative transcriptional regulator [Burkholderiaceae bacterium]|nr:FMN-binding negative transcriptional regulator [Burkholderiaceae bacterium]